jgi:hypothetical protein
MSNLEDRNAAKWDYATARYVNPNAYPAYPKLGPAVEKHRRLNDDSPEGRKAYGQAVLKAINALNRQKLVGASGPVNPRSPCASGTWHSEGKDILKAIRTQHRTATQAAANGPTFERTEDELERDYYRAMLESRGVDSRKIEGLANMEQTKNLTLWLKAAWNVIKTKRGTPYLAEAKAEPAPQPEAIEPAPQPKRGRPLGSKNKPKLVAEPVKPAEPPKPSKPRVPSHYLSSASPVAYHAAM